MRTEQNDCLIESFRLLREIFYVIEEGFASAKLLAHAQNSILRVINNDTYDEMPLIFNRLAPATFTKNKVKPVFCVKPNLTIYSRSVSLATHFSPKESLWISR